MDLRQLTYFVRVAELMSFSKASRTLRIAQPALGAQIKKLENEMGATLFVRHARGVEPTEAGLTLLKHAEDILLAAERARRAMLDFTGPPRGRVDLGLPPSHFLAVEIAKHCLSELPKVSINIVEDFMTGLIDGVADDRLDFACVFRQPSLNGLAYEPLVRENLLLVGAPGVMPRKSGAVAFRDLVKYPLVLPRRPHRIRQRIDDLCARQGVSLKIVLEMAEPAATQLVAEGICCALRPYSTVRAELQRKTLVGREVVDPALTLELGLTFKERRPLSKAASAVAALVRTIVYGDPALRTGRWQRAERPSG